MTATYEHVRPSACPACSAAPVTEPEAAPAKDAAILLSLPEIHCAGCISGVERALNGVPGVRSARVNLTLKRASVEAAPDITAAQLVGVLDVAGYEAHELDPGVLSGAATDARGRDLAMRLAVAFFAMMNVMLLSVAVWSGAEGATRDLMHWISAAIAIPAVIFSGRPFYLSAWSALKGRRLNMDVPITLAIVLAMGTSLYETMLSGEHAYFDAGISLCFFLLAGRYLDHKTRATARSAAAELAALEVPRAIRMTAAGQETISVAEIRAGDLVRVLPGARVPVDGVVTDGKSEIDRSLMTGESVPAVAGRGDAVQAGEVNLTGALTVRVTAAGRDTALHRIADLVAVAEAGRGKYTALADRAAGLYAPGVHVLSALAAVGWWIATQDLRVALNIAAAVLIITCPCALGLAVPAVTTAAAGRLFRRGLLIKNGTALERLAEVDTVVFDKTGTLTMGTPEPEGLDDHGPEEMSVALALAEGSAHPLSKALAGALRARGVVPAAVTEITERPGEGVEGRWMGGPARLGRAEWVGAAPAGTTASWLRLGDGAPRIFRFTDRIRPGAEETVAALKAAGKKVILLSGDTLPAVSRFAARLGIEAFAAGQSPADKAAGIEVLRGAGAVTLMVGDGLNDTAALAAAHVSISPATALDAARTASDIVLLGQDLSPVVEALKTGVRARKRITENFTLASVYNIVAVPLAVAGLATPLIAALAMSASSITVSLNAMRVR